MVEDIIFTHCANSRNQEKCNPEVMKYWQMERTDSLTDRHMLNPRDKKLEELNEICRNCPFFEGRD